MTAGGDQASNEACPGPSSEEAGKADACVGCPNQAICASAPKGPDPDVAAIAERLSNVKHKVLVLSGKGGVGKSTVSAQLAFALAQRQGCQVGLLDVDICGPSVPKMLGLEGEEIHQSNMGWSPVYVEDNLGVMSIGFLLPDPDNAVIWRGPRKNSLIKQFLKDTYWGELDYLLVDTPPGTSDEHISIAQYLKGADVDGAIIVTAPQEVSIIDVRKEINFCKKVGIKVLGVVENMSGLEHRVGDFRYRDETGADVTDRVLEEIRRVAPHLEGYLACTDVFHVSGGGGAAMAAEMGVPFLGRIPLDAKLSQACEEGRSVLDEMGSSPSMGAIRSVVSKLQGAVAGGKKDVPV